MLELAVPENAPVVGHFVQLLELELSEFAVELSAKLCAVAVLVVAVMLESLQAVVAVPELLRELLELELLAVEFQSAQKLEFPVLLVLEQRQVLELAVPASD